MIVNRKLRRDFGVLAQQNLGPKYLFSTISQLSGKFEGQYFRQRTWQRKSRKNVGNCEQSPTSSRDFVNCGPRTAKNETVIFTNPPKMLQFSSHMQFSRQNSTKLCYTVCGG